MPSNEAVWLTAKGGAFERRPAPYTPPGDTEIVVRNHAVAINPIDWLMPIMGGLAFPWIKYPTVLGSDVAGEVVEVGAAVTRFRVGDRVLGHAVGINKDRNRPAEGAFQTYTVLLEHMAAPIPDAMAYETAAVLPLGLSTAACGLFEKEFLALAPPSAAPAPTGKTVLVWGGSTSVGSNAIQLAVAAGCEVIATASPKNFGYVMGLGASQAFDYRSGSVVADVAKAFEGRTLAGALAIGVGSAASCVAIAGKCSGNRFVAMATPPVAFDDAPEGGRGLWLASKIARMAPANVSLMLKSRTGGVRTRFIFGSSLANNEVGPAIYGDFLPSALGEGRYRAAPEAWVVGRGLDQIPAALAAQRRGVSARKVVVSL